MLKITKPIFLLLVCIFIAIGLNAKYYITTQEVKVRAGKGNKFEELGTIPKGTKVQSEDNTGKWIKLIDQGEVGYVEAKYLEEAQPDVVTPSDNSAQGSVKDWINHHMLVAGGLLIVVLLIFRSIMLSISAKKSENLAVEYEQKYRSLHKYWFQCKHCAAAIKNENEPSANGCSKSLHHHWTNLGEVGQHKYHCKNCGVTVHTKMDPSDHGCPSSTLHRWIKKK
jgi:hypothetical protein